MAYIPISWNSPRSPLESDWYYREPSELLRRRSSSIGFAMLGYLVLANVISLVAMAFLAWTGLFDSRQASNSWQGMEHNVYYITYGLYATVSMVLPFVAVLRFNRVPVVEVFHGDRVKISILIPFIMLGLGACMIANLATSLFAGNLSLFGFSPYMPEQPYDNNPMTVILMVIGLSVVPAFVEEFAFRGVVLGLLRRFGDGFAIVASAFLFGVLHGNLIQAPFALIVGIILGFLVVKTNSIWPAVLLHFINNCYAVLLEVASHNMGEMSYNFLSYGSMIAFLLLGLLGAGILLRKDRFCFSLRPYAGAMAFRKRVSTLLISPGVLCIIVLLILQAVLLQFLSMT
jgi:membrane protease YdiL (CAAX protease family)